MFLNILKENEKIAFIQLAKVIIKADKHIANQEMLLLKSFRDELDMDEVLNLSENSESIEWLCNQFSSPKSKVSALMELIGMGYVDGKFVMEEQNLIFEIAGYMGINADETKMYIDWASKVYSR